MYKPKVLIVATSRKTRGGITSVVKAHESGKQWKKYHCKWIETHRDGNFVQKLWYLTTALIKYYALLPFYNIVHIHIATTKSAKRKMLFFYPAKWLGKKTIFHFHPSNEKFLFEPNNQKLYYSLFSKADLIIVLSEQWEKWIKEALGITKNIKILYNPCPIVNFRPELKQKSILFAGTIIHRKGYEDLIYAFANIASKYPDWKITFAGNGEIDRAKEIARKNKIEKQVIFPGWIQGKDKEKIFQEASIYCLASYGEGFPMGVLDAWAYGIPCIVTLVGGLPDIVIEGKNALTFIPGDIKTLTMQLEKMITNDILRNNIAKESLKLAQTTFSINNINSQLDQIYNQLGIENGNI